MYLSFCAREEIGGFMKKKNSSYEGLQTHIRKMKTPAVEVWENQYQGRDYEISITIPEFTCICPKTGLPDFATLYINYIPRKYCIELKSLKLYLNWYRNVGIFHEHVVNRILDDLVKVCKPKWMEIKGDFNPRGGIYTDVVVRYGRKSS